MPNMQTLSASQVRSAKSFEMMPAAQTAMAGLTSPQKSSRAYEILPPVGVATQGLKSGGCGCGGKCNSTGSPDSCAKFPALGDPSKWPVPPSSGSDLPKPIYGPVVPIGSAPAQGASLCSGILDTINRLMRERQRLLETFGPRDISDPVTEAWNAARRACAAADQRELCVALGDLFTRSPLSGPGVAIRNAIWDLWNQCVLGLIDASRYHWFLCWAAVEYAREVERQARERLMRTTPIDYARDILPLDVEIARLEREYRTCLSTGGQGTGMPPVRPACGEHCSGEFCEFCCGGACVGDPAGRDACVARCYPIRAIYGS